MRDNATMLTTKGSSRQTSFLWCARLAARRALELWQDGWKGKVLCLVCLTITAVPLYALGISVVWAVTSSLVAFYLLLTFAMFLTLSIEESPQF